jgi:hypothetical protein
MSAFSSFPHHRPEDDTCRRLGTARFNDNAHKFCADCEIVYQVPGAFAVLADSKRLRTSSRTSEDGVSTAGIDCSEDCQRAVETLTP